jgi:dTDP-4-dehydrorhamnose reductase
MADWLSRRTGRTRGVLVPCDWRERDIARRAANAVLDVGKFERSTGTRAPTWEPAVAQLLEEMVPAAERPAPDMP